MPRAGGHQRRRDQRQRVSGHSAHRDGIDVWMVVDGAVPERGGIRSCDPAQLGVTTTGTMLVVRNNSVDEGVMMGLDRRAHVDLCVAMIG